jgi:hypothetical protein
VELEGYGDGTSRRSESVFIAVGLADGWINCHIASDEWIYT